MTRLIWFHWGRLPLVAVRVNRHFIEADVRILTGFIEPHFFAGFSGPQRGAGPGRGRAC